MSKKVEIYKKDLNQALTELTKGMREKNWFVNITTKKHKDKEKIYLVIG
jgi:hypothetical protein